MVAIGYQPVSSRALVTRPEWFSCPWLTTGHSPSGQLHAPPLRNWSFFPSWGSMWWPFCRCWVPLTGLTCCINVKYKCCRRLDFDLGVEKGLAPSLMKVIAFVDSKPGVSSCTSPAPVCQQGTGAICHGASNAVLRPKLPCTLLCVTESLFDQSLSWDPLCQFYTFYMAFMFADIPYNWLYNFVRPKAFRYEISFIRSM